MPHAEQDGFAAKQTCCPNPTKSPLTSDLICTTQKREQRHRRRKRVDRMGAGDKKRDGVQKNHVKEIHASHNVQQYSNNSYFEEQTTHLLCVLLRVCVVCRVFEQHLCSALLCHTERHQCPSGPHLYLGVGKMHLLLSVHPTT